MSKDLSGEYEEPLEPLPPKSRLLDDAGIPLPVEPLYDPLPASAPDSFRKNNPRSTTKRPGKMWMALLILLTLLFSGMVIYLLLP